MGIASSQDLPIKKTEKSEWSVRRLFPFADVSKALAKTFISVFDVLLGFSILVIGLCELLNNQVSWFFYILAVLLLGCAFAERRGITLEHPKETK